VYSPFYEGIYFDRTTLRYTKAVPGEGLTCATLIMAVFDALGLALFDVETWPGRDDDADWQRSIIHVVKSPPAATSEHINAIRGRPRRARCRPEEVAGSVAESARPVPFERAQAAGLQKPQGLFAIVNWHQRPCEETPILDEPRDPRTGLRMSPEQTIRSVEAGELKFAKLVELTAYRYSFERPSSREHHAAAA